MTDNEKQTCLNELRALVAEFYGKDGSAVEQRKAARAYISSVQDLAGKIDTLTTRVKKLEDEKADRAQENESDKGLGSLVKEVERLRNLINGKRDTSDIPTDADTQINKLWENLYALEKKYNEKSWCSTWSGFHPTLASFSPTFISGSLTGAEFSVGGLALKVRVWYFTFDIKSATFNGAKVKLSGIKSMCFLLASFFSCGLSGLFFARRMRTKINKATTELMRIATAASSVCTDNLQVVN